MALPTASAGSPVRRSKCLPEGGRIHTVNFDDITGRLKSAVDFARDAGELTRDAAATLLWHSAYPLLSEGKPGMLGAVTGRSEAQVMRLSAIYALLDESRIIRPAHHHAAIALWDYCVRSTRWIFGTATGDKNADKTARSPPPGRPRRPHPHADHRRYLQAASQHACPHGIAADIAGDRRSHLCSRTRRERRHRAVVCIRKTREVGEPREPGEVGEAGGVLFLCN